VDAIIFATLSPDYFFPGSAVLLQKTLCPRKMWLLWMSGISVQDFLQPFRGGRLVRSGMYKCVLVVGSETPQQWLDLTPEGRDISVFLGMEQVLLSLNRRSRG